MVDQRVIALVSQHREHLRQRRAVRREERPFCAVHRALDIPHILEHARLRQAADLVRVDAAQVELRPDAQLPHDGAPGIRDRRLHLTDAVRVQSAAAVEQPLADGLPVLRDPAAAVAHIRHTGAVDHTRCPRRRREAARPAHGGLAAGELRRHGPVIRRAGLAVVEVIGQLRRLIGQRVREILALAHAQLVTLGPLAAHRPAQMDGLGAARLLHAHAVAGDVLCIARHVAAHRRGEQAYVLPRVRERHGRLRAARRQRQRHHQRQQRRRQAAGKRSLFHRRLLSAAQPPGNGKFCLALLSHTFGSLSTGAGRLSPLFPQSLPCSAAESSSKETLFCCFRRRIIDLLRRKRCRASHVPAQVLRPDGAAQEANCHVSHSDSQQDFRSRSQAL